MVLLWLLVAFTGGAICTALMEKVDWLTGLLSSSLLFFVASGILYFLFRYAGSGRALAWLMAAAFILRLGLGITLMKSLPVSGYPTEQQQAGYVFFDAFRRDTKAASLALSDKPILWTFTDRYAVDQYGGYLAGSIFVYRYISPEVHRPHLLLILSAFAGTAATVFFWMLSRKVGGEELARFSSWMFVLFPHSVLMGASQMREPWLILFLTMAFWAVVEWRLESARKPLWFLAASIVGFLLVSPGMILLTVIFLAGWIILEKRDKPIPLWVFIAGGFLALVGITAFAYGLSSSEQLAKDSAFEVVMRWFKNAIAWDIRLSTAGSGRLEFLFESIPPALQTPFILAYGVFQPVLPAALLDRAQVIWNVISSTLAAGWWFLLPLLIYTTIAVRGEKNTRLRNQLIWTAVVSWVWILICSARAGGDQWDNPRYRVIAMPFLAILAGWGWLWARDHQFVWLKRIWLVEGVFLLFFTQWYASRYYQSFGRLDLKVMILLISIIGVSILVGGYLKDRYPGRGLNKNR
jgi:hypothetical protein